MTHHFNDFDSRAIPVFGQHSVPFGQTLNPPHGIKSARKKPMSYFVGQNQKSFQGGF